jgi:hypothetical protein
VTQPVTSTWAGMHLVLLNVHGEPQMLLNRLAVATVADDRKRLDTRTDAAP